MTPLQAYADLQVAPPTPTGESQYFWESAAQDRLVLQRCTACGTHQGHPRRRCSRCWGDTLVWVESPGHATVVTHTTVHRPGQASWRAVAPYHVGLVRLDEGAVVLTHLLPRTGGEDRPRVGDRCTVRFVRVGDWTLPFFRLDESDKQQVVP
jgi:uncharacterized OB-fold protein